MSLENSEDKVVEQEEELCNFCKKPAQSKCSGCHSIVYCSKEHQKLDWKSHKAFCKPYEVKTDEVLGRHLVATRNIKAGDVVFKEPPLIWGPSQVTVPVCLGCGKGLTRETQRPCQKCGWPMCSEICQNSPAHLPECSYTVNRGDKANISVFDIPHPSYQCLTTLRCLYNKQFLPEVWSKLESLQSHCEERKKTIKYEQDRVTVAAFIRRFYKLDVEEELLLKICGIININGHEVPLTEPPNVAVYHVASMLEHNCAANCGKTFTSKGEILIVAGSQGIKRGDHLSICYTDPLWSTPNRRHHLHETKYFWCNCARCLDVTEFGTYLSCIKCTDKKCNGLSTPKSFLESVSNGPWECRKCHKVVSNEEVNNLLEDYGKMLQDMQKGSSSAAKLFIKQSEAHLPSTHFYVIDVKVALSEILGQEYNGGLADLSDDNLLLKLKICKEILKLVEKIAPAEHRIRGTLLFELHASIAELAQRKVTSGQEGPDYLYLSLLESKKILMQSIDALKHESTLMPEGKVCQQAKINLKDMTALLGTVQKSHNRVNIP